MARSVLLQLLHDSIQEVFLAQRSINQDALLSEHPLLAQSIPTTVNIHLAGKLRGTYSSVDTQSSLLTNIIIAAKKAAFEDKRETPLTTSEYLHCEIELRLQTPDGEISEIDPPIIKET
jgi:hypothetical protein